MSLIVVCSECGHVLYEGMEMISLYWLRMKTNGKCTSCQRKLAVDPVSVEIKEAGKWIGLSIENI